MNGSIIHVPRGWKLVVFFIGIGLAFDQEQGQVENVFGEESLPANPAGFENTAETVSPPAQPSLPRDDHLVVQSLRQRPPRTPSEYGRAMLYLRRIERWGEMARLLDLVGKEPLTTQSYLQLVRGAGLDVWLAMEQQTDAFNEAQRQQIRTIIDGSSQAVTQPEVLVEAVKNLINRSCTNESGGPSPSKPPASGAYRSCLKRLPPPPPSLADRIGGGHLDGKTG